MLWRVGDMPGASQSKPLPSVAPVIIGHPGKEKFGKTLEITDGQHFATLFQDEAGHEKSLLTIASMPFPFPSLEKIRSLDSGAGARNMQVGVRERSHATRIPGSLAHANRCLSELTRVSASGARGS